MINQDIFLDDCPTPNVSARSLWYKYSEMITSKVIFTVGMPVVFPEHQYRPLTQEEEDDLFLLQELKQLNQLDPFNWEYLNKLEKRKYFLNKSRIRK